MQVDIIPLFENNTQATKDSAKVWVGNYDRVAVLFRRAANAGGSGAFTVKGGFGAGPAADPTMSDLNTMVDNATNTNVQNLVRANGKTISNADGDRFMWLDPATPVTHIQVSVARTSDGTHSAYLYGFNNA